MSSIFSCRKSFSGRQQQSCQTQHTHFQSKAKTLCDSSIAYPISQFFKKTIARLQADAKSEKFSIVLNDLGPDSFETVTNPTNNDDQEGIRGLALPGMSGSVDWG